MFEEIPFIVGFMIFSMILSYVAFKYVPPPFSGIIKAFSLVGIVEWIEYKGIKYQNIKYAFIKFISNSIICE